MTEERIPVQRNASHVRILALVPIAFLLLPGTVRSQDYGKIVIVTPVRVSVSIDGVYRGESTSKSRCSLIDSIPPGTHRIRVSKEGFPPQEDTCKLSGSTFVFPVQPFGPEAGVDSAEYAPPLGIKVDQEPAYVHSVVPDYPEEAAAKGLEGKVWVTAWVSKEGRVEDPVILTSDNKIFNAPSIIAAWGFRFKPAYLKGVPVEVWVSIPFKFKLKG